ncbi:MAG: chitobiase/beta-hexosaminidase C-terminal domain-containing protein [Armatimonadetes bacterium]|nr:chitobiase/beta-hexosaminidase C-terminal domain-containing protein [Armatimonadota bacterium]
MKIRITTLLILFAVLILSGNTGWCYTIYVAQAGNDSWSGFTWEEAKGTIAAALESATPGDEVWVAAGTYAGPVILRRDIALYGGFAGTEGNREERNPSQNPTIIDGNNSGSAVIAPPGAGLETRIDGFVIRNGSGTYDGITTCGGAIYCYDSSPTISNNVIELNSATYGGAIYCFFSSPLIEGNTIRSNIADYGAGIHLEYYSSPAVNRNTFTGNSAQYGGALSCYYYCFPSVSDNSILQNTAYLGGGIYCEYASPSILANVIRNNTAEAGGALYTWYYSASTFANNVVWQNSASYGSGIVSYYYGTDLIANNTIAANTATVDDAAITCDTSNPVIVNNLILGNSGGINATGQSVPGVRNNDLWQNIYYDYQGLSQGAGDVSVDPSVVDADSGDFRLNDASPCVDIGDDAVVKPEWHDVGGNWRIYGSNVDIGAHELALPELLPTPILSPHGGTYGTPVSVTVACPTPDVTLRYTTNGIDPTSQDQIVNGPIAIDRSLTLKVKAWSSETVTSAVQVADYVLKAATPTFTPNGGTFNFVQYVTISCSTPGATIRYTTNGDDPNESSPDVTWPIQVASQLTLKAKAWKEGWTESETGSAEFLVRPPRLHVNKTASGPIRDGLSWQSAYTSLRDATEAAIQGDEIWVAAGTYSGPIILRSGIKMYGGFAGNETSLSQRNWKTRITVIDGRQLDTTVTILSGSSTLTRLDGFTVQNGLTSELGGGIRCDAAATIANSVIKGNSAGYGGGIACTGEPASVIDNLIVNNTALQGGGIFCRETASQIINNTVANNQASSGGGIAFLNSSPALRNNVVAFNSSGILARGLSFAKLTSNCVYGNGASNYVGLSAGQSDVLSDPKMVSPSTGDYHLTLTSPCVNAGQAAATDQPERYDLDAGPRVFPAGTVVDIGVDEYAEDAVYSPQSAKALVPDGQQVIISAPRGLVVSATFPSLPAFYIEQVDRACGIQCRSSEPLQPGQGGMLQGVMATISGERALTNATLVPGTLFVTDIPRPLGLNLRDLGGGVYGLQRRIDEAYGVNNIGLLVRCWGTVTTIQESSFMLDEGNRASALVMLPAGVVPPPDGSKVAAIGISSCYDTGYELVRLLRVRGANDITILRNE